MEMIKIDQLPVEILMKIFQYLPSYKDVSLVNKLLYDVACSVNDPKIWVSFSKVFMKDCDHRSVMNSIEKTQRKISKLSISFGASTQCYYGLSTKLRESAISDVVKIVEKFSATIKYFRLRHCSIKMCDLLQILSLLPNAEHLEFLYVKIEKVEMEPSSPMSFGNETLQFDGGETLEPSSLMSPGNESLQLHRVETLLLEHCCQQFLAVFNRLPGDVLKELTVVHWNQDLNVLAGLFEQQSKITKLSLADEDESDDEIRLPDRIFEHLKLKSLEIFQHREYNITNTKILSEQTELTSLSLREGKADGNVLNTITTQLTKLKTLVINVSLAAIVPFKKIVKLNGLNDLTLESCSLELMETLASLDNSRIAALQMTDIHTEYDDDNDEYPPMPINVISALAFSLPNLKMLEFEYCCELEAICAIMQNFNYVETLDMKFDSIIDPNRLARTIEIDRCFNPKLSELRISEQFLFDKPILTKLVAIFPNVKKLFLVSSASITTTQLKFILNGFKQMESLTLYCETKSLTTEHLECVKNQKNNLKFVTLSGLNFDMWKLPVEQEKMLRSIFDYIRYTSGTLHMSCEKIVTK